MVNKVRSYREVSRAVTRAAREIPSLQIQEMGPVRMETGGYPFYHLTLTGDKGRNPSPHPVFISGGIHGDEPAGVWAILEFLHRFRSLPELYHRFDYTILPCTNPFGFENNTRQNAYGMDLNRQFRNPSPPVEVQLIKEAVMDRSFSLAIEFHEDVDTAGFYMYELQHDGEASLGREIIDRIGAKYPVNLNDVIEGLSADRGLIHRRNSEEAFRRLIEDRENWPQAFYHFTNGSRHSITTETPVFLSREERIEIHLMALEVALQKLA